MHLHLYPPSGRELHNTMQLKTILSLENQTQKISDYFSLNRNYKAAKEMLHNYSLFTSIHSACDRIGYYLILPQSSVLHSNGS